MFKCNVPLFACTIFGCCLPLGGRACVGWPCWTRHAGSMVVRAHPPVHAYAVGFATSNEVLRKASGYKFGTGSLSGMQCFVVLCWVGVYSRWPAKKPHICRRWLRSHIPRRILPGTERRTFLRGVGLYIRTRTRMWVYQILGPGYCMLGSSLVVWNDGDWNPRRSCSRVRPPPPGDDAGYLWRSSAPPRQFLCIRLMYKRIDVSSDIERPPVDCG